MRSVSFIFFVVLASWPGARVARAAGARSFKSGSVQVSADGRSVWVVNPDHDSVSRLDTSDLSLVEFVLPQAPPPALPVRHAPRGLALSEDGSEVWVACADSDLVFVLDAGGNELARIELPWGSAPTAVALSRDQEMALVACLRGDSLAVLDVTTRSLRSLLPTFRTPQGIAFLEDGVSAWVTHFQVWDRLARLSRIALGGAEPVVTTVERTDGSGPQDSAALREPDPARNVAEGGYLTFRGQLGQRPGSTRVWVPTQYGNRNQTLVTPDSIVQAVVRQIDLDTRRLPNLLTDKIILTAPQVHDPPTGAWEGEGWNAPVAGPVDLAFSADGALCLLVFEQSENLLVLPTATPGVRPPGAPDLPTVEVGRRPTGLAWAPVPIGGRELAFVSNELSRSLSVIDVTNPLSPTLLAEVATTPLSPEPFDPTFLEGEHLFHTSNDPRVSSNRKVACASCHVRGEQDGRAWLLQYLPGNHGPRQTQSLLGLNLSFGGPDPMTGYGQLHRSGDRDEVQDFEHTFRGQQMGGTGFLDDTQLQPPLGAGPNGGLDPDLDALASYVLALPPLPRSPWRAADGSLSSAAQRGATMFLGAGAGPADGGCARCHVPETGFTDRAFHDVGSYRPALAPTAENELGGARGWEVNTPSLVGLFATPPYNGFAPRDAESLLGALLDGRDPGRSLPHGSLDGFTGRQLMDLAAFLGSLDGNTSAAEVRAAVDLAGPRIVRVAPSSLTRLEVWFDESVAPDATAASAWRLDGPGGTDVRVLSGRLDPVRGDHLTLSLSGFERPCASAGYQLVPLGPISDLADAVSGGRANLLDTADPGNAPSFVVGDTLTVTFGVSGQETFLVPVHDAGTLVSLPDWGSGTIWLRAIADGTMPNTDFLRFEWEDAFAAAGGPSDPLDLLEASFSLSGDVGDSQVVEVRRVLQAWWDHHVEPPRPPIDPVSGHGGPTWRDSEYGVKAWNQLGARARSAGVEGSSPADYLGAQDVSFTPDLVLPMQEIGRPTVFGSTGITDAFRFWLQHPDLDFGFALEIPVGSKHETRFHASEEELGQFGPVLSLTYRLPAPSGASVGEVSGAASPAPLLLAREPLGLLLSFEDLGPAASSYHVHSGMIGNWGAHAALACSVAASPAAGHLDATVPEDTGSLYYLVTASDGCSEGPIGFDSFGLPRPPSAPGCPP